MNIFQKVDYLKQSIDEARSEGLNNIADLHAEELQEIYQSGILDWTPDEAVENHEEMD